MFMSLLTVTVLPFMCACGGDDDDEGKNDNGGKGKMSTEYVDLGLSVKWATCNLGASNPWEYGNYYAWGETKPKSEYTVANYTYKNNNPNTLPLTDDAASVNLGNLWHTPTRDEFQELIDKCKRYKTTLNGTIGYRFVGPNGNSIFLPAAGAESPDTTYNEKNKYGFYWTSSLGQSFNFIHNEMFNFPYYYELYVESDDERYNSISYDKDDDGSLGFSIRAVHP